MRFRTLVLALTTVALVFTACGDDDGDGASPTAPTTETDQSATGADPPDARPTVDDLSTKFEDDSGLSSSSADCVAELLVESDYSDAGLQLILDTDLREGGAIFPGDIAEEDRDVWSTMAQEIDACLD